MSGDSSPEKAPPHPPAPTPLTSPRNVALTYMTTRPQSQPIPIPTMRSNPIPPTPTDATSARQSPLMYSLRAHSSESFRQRDTARASAFSMSPDLAFHRVRINNGAPSAALQPRSSPIPSRPYGGAASMTDAKSVRSLAAASTISPEDEVLSLKVRSLYDSGVGLGGSDVESQFSKRVSSILEEGGKGGSKITRSSYAGRNSQSGDEAEGRFSLAADKIESPLLDKTEEPHGGPTEEEVKQSVDRPNGLGITSMERSEFLLAGGTEDWEDLHGGDVDRYGFIDQTYAPSTPNPAFPPPNPQTKSPAFAPPKRISTALHLHSTTPQKRAHHLQIKLSPFASSASEMLRSPLPGATAALHAKENSRAKKWREMAVVRKRGERGEEGGKGGGTDWGFVTVDAKLISRTWKGIPDCWRAAAWHAFLTASAKGRGIGKSDTELVTIYTDFIERPSADDVQIDLDVPRTISSHIMFRRRYRGGQRLLFRTLHALSLYFPEVGYVQGMASLAATLLCYYDEETTFIMLVRMFELRGLEKLYQAGFGGLMQALDEFEGGWMKGGQVSRRLINLGVTPTAYGTRWYLTLFNYSMPFAAQLRVWDVFMLLGDPDPASSAIAPAFSGSLDVLHATSTALIDGMKEILLKSDFEGSMKVLTSWIPVKDEELLMKVVKGEWKGRRKRRAKGGGGGGGGGGEGLGGGSPALQS